MQGRISLPSGRGRALSALLLVLLCLSSAAAALQVPPLKGRVNDYAAILSSATVKQMESFLADLEEADGTQIVVLTVRSLDGDPIEDFSMRVAEQWRIGRKGLDNGAILLIALEDRKLRIEVGYGLEGRLTDLAAGRIIRNVIAPRFKQGRFDQGVIDGVSAMVETVRGEYTSESPPGLRTRPPASPDAGIFSILAAAVLANGLGRIHLLLGGLVGAAALPLIARFFFGIVFPAVLAFLPIGLAAGIFAAAIGRSRSGSGIRRPYRRHIPTGGPLGGGSGGGFSSRGGFSGGGGGFGGGGASGSW